ncbi:SusC/RagA family TonB-linked outer membrane protein [Mucilaginibacter sp. FT3.2]|uniref:SusC/RagA family TonB-linked outer membrane protein n=1 Tax=Mucilaginibacter sp. FT3.2 TaxID=2723090 RepID=UPI001617C8BE
MLALLTLMVSGAYAQLRKITGTVKSNQGELLPGVSVKIKGTANGTVTNSNGVYNIAVTDNAAVLVFSYIGFVAQEKAVSGNTVMEVVLTAQSNNLNDVVVVGYGVQKKVNVIGSVSAIGSKELQDRPLSNVSQALTGLIPGAYIHQSSGQPGSDGASILIRGQGTLNSTTPLYVVDGVLTPTINDINPIDIESVSVLKDAASASIYGSRAANGVILITTKKGSKSKTSITYSGIVSQSRPSLVPSFVSDYITTMQLANQGAANTGSSPAYAASDITAWQQANANPNGLNPIGVPNYVAYPNTNWTNVIFKNYLSQDHNISVSGGSDNSQYLLSAGYLHEPGAMPNTGSDEYQFRINLQSKVAKFLTIGTQTFASLQTYKLGNVSTAFTYLNQTTPGVYPYYNGQFGYPSAPDESPTANNILAYLLETQGRNSQSRVNTTFFANFNIIKGLTWENKFNYQVISQEDNSAPPQYGKWNLATGVQSAPPGALTNSTSYYDFNKYYQTTFNSVLKYSTTIAKKHNLEVLAGFEQNYYNFYYFNVTKAGIIDPSIYTLNSVTTPTSANGDQLDYGLRSFFGRLDYNYKQKYLFEAVFRNDGSSKFAPNDRWGFFPAFAAGWRLSQEPFMQNINNTVSNLKLKASWGITGNNVLSSNAVNSESYSSNQVGLYNYQSTYGATSYAFNGVQVNGLNIQTFSNPNIQWEKTSLTNIGLEGGLFHDRLSVDLDVYRKLTTGILYAPPIPLTAGTASAPVVNIGSMENKGVEIALNFHDHIGGFVYNISGNFAYNFNRLTSYKGALNSDYSNISQVASISGNNAVVQGHAYNSFYLYQTYKGSGSYFNGDGSVNKNGGPKDGMIRTTKDMDWVKAMIAAGYTFKPNSTIGPSNLYYGELIFADVNGDGVYGGTSDQRLSSKSPIPKYTGGLQFNFSYKGVDLSMMWAGSFGAYNYLAQGGYTNSYVGTGHSISTLIANNHYYYDVANPSDPLNNLNAKYPRLTNNINDPQDLSLPSNFYLYNASYVKLKNAQIGYTFSNSIVKKLGMSRLRIFVSADNLFTITNYVPGLDPEIGGGFSYPTLRQFSGGLNATF